MFLNNQQVTEEIRGEIKKISRNKWQENMITQNPWDAANPALRGKFIVIQSYLKKQVKHRIDSLTLQLKQLGKEQANKNLGERKKDPSQYKWKRNERNNSKDE